MVRSDLAVRLLFSRSARAVSLLPPAPVRVACTLGVLAALLVPSGSAAQPHEANSAVAQRLFEQGRSLMQAGQFEQACPKLAESHRLDPAGGTLLNLATCYEKQGKTATAWLTFQDARAVARRDGNQQRIDFATRHIEALQPRLSYLTIVVGEAVRAPGVAILLDGRRLAPPLWGTDIPIDVGNHRIEASAPQRAAWSQKVTIQRDAERLTVSVPELAAVGETPAKTAPTIVPAASPGEELAAGQSSAEVREGQSADSSTLGFVIGAGGIAALAVGSYFGLRAVSSWQERNDHCGAEGCDPAGLAAGEDTERNGNLSTVGFGVGIVAVGVGTYLILSSAGEADAAKPSAGARRIPGSRITPAVGSHGGGLMLRGTW